MKSFEGYIHSGGSLMVKTVPQYAKTIVDQNSPHVAKYLGIVQMTSLNKAREYFINENGGKQYLDISEIKKDKKHVK